MGDLKRCYEILEIRPGSTYEEAKQAFRDMVSIWHPDKFSHNSRLKEKAEEKLKDLNAAWEQLQAFFLQKENTVAEQHCRELAEPVKTNLSRERQHREREEKAVRPDCSFVDLAFEPLVHFEQALKAYRHRSHSRNLDRDCSDLNAQQGFDSDFDVNESEGMCPKKRAGEGKLCDTTQQLEIRNIRHALEGKDIAHRLKDELETREKNVGAVKQYEKEDKEPTMGRKAAQHSLDDNFNEEDRKIRLLSDSFCLGFLERKFFDWQQREREYKKQQDAAKDIARKNKKMADLFLTRYKMWLAKQKSKNKTSSKIRSLFKINPTPIGGNNPRKFLFGIPDISLEFVKGGSFLMGNGMGNTFDKMPSRNSEQPYRVVTVDDFYIGKYPITVRQWSKVMGVEMEGAEQDLPVPLNPDGVQEFIFRLNDITGLKFRVPTEAEWEYAARSDGKEKKWSGISDGSAIYDHSSSNRRKVRQSKPNGLGFVDILENSSEWVTGSYPKQPQQNGLQGNTKGIGNGKLVIRGPVYRDLHKNYTPSNTSHRSFFSADKVMRFGFRLAHAPF
jgi:formylglycine-generating enzyme required for sulfatase activity